MEGGYNLDHKKEKVKIKKVFNTHDHSNKAIGKLFFTCEHLPPFQQRSNYNCNSADNCRDNSRMFNIIPE